MPAVVKFYSNKKIFELFIKKFLKKILLFPVPNILVKKLMEIKYTDMGTELTNGCNANCSFCAYRFQKRQKKVTNYEMFKKSIDNLSTDGGGTVSFTPVVGDPLVDKKIIQKINYCISKKNINSVYLYTNGIFLDNYDTKEFLSSGLNRLAISTFFGSRDLYKKYFGVDEYDRVIKNIKNIAKTNNENNYKVKITLHLRVEMPDDTWKNNKDFLEIRDLVGEKNISYKSDYENWSGMINQSDLPSGCTLGETPNFKEKNSIPCWELYRKVYVMSDSNVGVCPSRDMEGEIKIGNLNDNTLREIWSGNKIKEFRKNWKNGILPNVCKNCDRYESIDSYIKNNKYSILRTQILKRILKLEKYS